MKIFNGLIRLLSKDGFKNLFAPKCYKCKNKLKDYGGLVFSPPKNKYDFLEMTVNKYHICTECWDDLLKWMKSGNGSNV